MFFVDKPYLSDFFKNTLKDNDLPVVLTESAKGLDLYPGTKTISEEAAIEMAQATEDLIVYTTSENAIGWLAKHLPFSSLPEKIELFKNKLTFRRLIQPLFPDFYFREVRADDLDTVAFNEIPRPFIIKPAVGFFSMGVYMITNHEDWIEAIAAIRVEMEQIKDLYPTEVLNAGSFIIEQCILGEEFAVDTYFDAAGEAVVVGIYKHAFSSESDVSDRVYLSSKEIIESNLEDFTEFAGKIGRLAGVRNFPVHIELRRDNKGNLLPIEVNPMRFGGWCTTADMTSMAYGFNPYLAYYTQTRPDWPEILKGKDDKLYSIVVLDNSTGITGEKITSFDYQQLLADFEKPLELRKIDYKTYPVFAFLFTETRQDNFKELEHILDSDLRDYVSTT